MTNKIKASNLDTNAVTADAISYPLTTFSSTGIDDNATSTAITIDSSQNVGIGTTSPNTLLHLKSNNAEILFEDTNPDDTREAKIHTNAGDLIFQVGDDLTGTPTVDGQLTMFDGGSLIYSQSGTNRFNINTSGNVGIGASSPTASLHIENSTNADILIKNPTNGNDASLNINKAGSSSRGIIRFQSSNTWHVGSTRFTTNAFAISTNDDFNSSSEFRLTTTGLTLTGSLSKGSGSFKIDHPLPEKTNTHHLVHSFVESPQANNIYRGKVQLVSGTATVNVDTVSGMTEGTFVLLNRDIQCFTSNETGWTAVKGSVSGNTLTITAQDNTCTDTISWMVIGERQDQHMIDTDWTDDNGKVIVEPLKETEEF